MPGAPSTNSEMSSSVNEAGSSQNEMLFMRGKAMSGAPIISGTNQLPKPPISAGMTMKKIIDQAMRGDEHVVEVLGVIASPGPAGAPSKMRASNGKTWMPGSCSSARIAIDKAAPMTPAMIAKII